MRLFRYLLPILLIIAAISLAGCSKKNPRLASPVVKVALEPADAMLVGQEMLNIPYWIDLGVKHRVLVRFSSIDGLVPVSDDIMRHITTLSKKEDFKGISEIAVRANEYTAENTVYIANHLGIVDELVWVTPSLYPLTQADLDGYLKFSAEKHPELKNAYSSLKFKDGVIEGKVFDVPVRIVALQDLPKLDKPVLLDIDVSYFQAIYQGEKETGILTLPSGLVNNLKDKGLSSDIVTVSPSTGSVSPRFRFLAGYIKELLHDPGMTDKAPPRLWKDRAEAWRIAQKSYSEAIPVLKDILKSNKDDTATHYDLANAYFESGDYTACKAELDIAYRLDDGYGYGYEDFAARLVQKGDKDKAALFAAIPAR